MCQLKRHDKGEYIFPIPSFEPNQLDKAPLLDENANPYKGLESFEKHDIITVSVAQVLLKAVDNCLTSRFFIHRMCLVQLTLESSAVSLTQEQRDWATPTLRDCLRHQRIAQMTIFHAFKQLLVLLCVQKPDAGDRQLCTCEFHHLVPGFHLDVQV